MELEDWDDQRPPQDLDQYLNGINQMESLFNETLTGILDLDVPTGFAVNEKYKTHSRKISGTAIFGYSDHGKLLLISGKKEDEILVTPSQLIHEPADYDAKPIHLLEEDEFQLLETKGKPVDEDIFVSAQTPKAYKFPPSPAENNHNHHQGLQNERNNLPHDLHESLGFRIPQSNDYSPQMNVMVNQPSGPPLNSYNVKSLQEFSDMKSIEYVEDIEPLLNEKVMIPQYQSLPFVNQKFIPIPVQGPVSGLQSPSRGSPQREQREQRRSKEHLQYQMEKHMAIRDQVFLPPPLPPKLSHGLPEWLLPEPQLPSPSRSFVYGASNLPQNPMLSSPIHQNQAGNRNFYTPQFFSDNHPAGVGMENGHSSADGGGNSANGGFIALGSNNYLPYNRPSVQSQLSLLSLLPQKGFYHHQLPSSPASNNRGINLINLSPIKSLNSSPLRQTLINVDPDELIDVNATILQLTPQKPDKIDLKWSPVILPNAKDSYQDLRKTIQKLTPKKKAEKASLLPPGQLDQYWEGPDENKIFTCTYKGCGKKFTRRYNVRLHIQTHLSDRPYACMYCPKNFVRQHDLNRHVKGHKETRYCKCQCNKEFTRLDVLRKHKERNICIGGILKQPANEVSGITKPNKKKIDQLFVDKVTSDMINEELLNNHA